MSGWRCRQTGREPFPERLPYELNHLVLTARLIERGPLRYTPAGVPALDCRLAQEPA